MTLSRLLDARFRHEQVVVSYAVLFLASLAALPRLGGNFAILTNVLYFGMGAATIWSQLQVPRRLALDGPTRRAWLFLAASSATLWVNGIVWTIWLASSGAALPVALELFIDFGYIPLALAAFAVFPSRARFSLRDPRVQLDGALFGLGGLALSWHFALRPLLTGNDENLVAALLPIVGEWGIALVASAAFLRVASRRDREAIGFFLAAHLTYILTDYFWTMARGQYVPGHWVDAFWFLAWMVRWVGARRALHARTEAAPADLAYHGGLAPSLFVVGAYLLLVLALLVEPGGGAVDIALAASTMTVLLLVRQRVALDENRALARETEAQTARFRSLAASATDFVLVVDDRLHVAYASPSIERVAGALLATPFASHLHPDDRPGLASWLGDRAAAASRTHRCRLRAAGGEWRDVEFRVEDRRGDQLVRGFVLNGRDISAELRLESQLGHARKLATLSDMAGRIAHAFNNTLAVLQGHAELLMSELPDDAPAREDVRAIRAAAERGAGITRQLLGFSGRHVIRPELLDPGEVIAALLPTLTRLLPPQVSIVVDRDSHGMVRLDRAQFEQVLVNLVANARDGMPLGGRIRLLVREHAQQLGHGDDRREVAIEVSDEGVGIPAELRERVFEPFFTTKSPGQGTGLGLAMVASIVKRAGGRIEVDSEVGRGTTFAVILPRAEAEGAPAAPRARALTPPSNSAGVVLLVDDDPLVRRASARIIERSGFTVLEAGSGAEALALAAEPLRSIDVLLTDLMMPGVSGREVITRFRSLRPGVPIVCVTGFASEREEGSTLALEVHAIVAKPFTSEALTHALRSALSPRAHHSAS